MRRRTTLLVAVVLAGALVLPSAAAPLAERGHDDLGSSITLAPSDGSNGDYASVHDGELVVDLTEGEAAGVNRDAVTAFDDVFSVRYSGSRYADVWLTHESEAVTLYARGGPIESATDSVTLGPDDSLAVGIRVDTTGQVDGALLDDITVHSRVAEPERDASVSEADLGPNVRSTATADSRQFTVLHAPAGESVALNTSGLAVAGANVTLEELAVTRATSGPLSVTVTRTGPSAAGSLPARDGAEALGGVRVDVGDGGDVQRASFRFSVAEAYLDALETEAGDLTLYRHSDGEWSELDATVVGHRGDRVLVAAETPGLSTFVLAAERPAIGVESATVDARTVSAGEPVTVTAEVTNTGGAAGEQAVTLALGGDVVAERTVALGASESTTVTFTVTPSPGEYEVSVGSVDAGALVVVPGSDDGQADASAQSENETATDPSGVDAEGTPVAEPAGIDLSAVAGVSALLVLVVAVLALVRRLPRG